MNYIITYFPEFKRQASAEVKASGGTVNRYITANMAFVSFPEDATRFIGSEPVFTRHIMPVMREGIAPKDKEKAMPVILGLVKEIADIGTNREFSVQCRIVGSELEYKSKDIEVFVGSYFDTNGGIPVFSDYGLTDGGDNVAVISVLIYGSELFCGFSPACENLNFHSDEYRVLSRGGGREISRAENKLKEAIHKFRIKIGSEKGEYEEVGHEEAEESGIFALDVGAAPGGWSKVLADYGYNVYAVDPGELHPTLKNHPRITHFKARIEDLSFPQKFGIVVNDMNMDPQIASEIMNALAHNLIEGAYAILTLKLPFSDIGRSIGESVDILKDNYELLALKNLTHNRREVTALLRRK